jgi:Protein of unknown function (DUF3341)
MRNEDTVSFGIYSTNTAVEHGVEALQKDGFPNSDISVLFSENPAPRTLAQALAQKQSDNVQDRAAVGGGTGALVGGAMGWLIGMVALVIPGAGPFMVAGPIFAALVGAGVGGLVGEIAGALMGMGMPEDDAARYEEQVKRGGILLSVHAYDLHRAKRGKEILEQTGALDISSTWEAQPGTASLPEVRAVA